MPGNFCPVHDFTLLLCLIYMTFGKKNCDKTSDFSLVSRGIGTGKESEDPLQQFATFLSMKRYPPPYVASGV